METVLEGRICKRDGDRLVTMSGEECYDELKRMVWAASKKNGVQLTDEQAHDVATKLWERAGEFKPGVGSHLGGWLSMLASGYTRNAIRKTTLQAKTFGVPEDFDCPANECHDEKREIAKQRLIRLVGVAVQNGDITEDEFKQVLAYYGYGVRLDTGTKRTTDLMRFQGVLARLRYVGQVYGVS